MRAIPICAFNAAFDSRRRNADPMAATGSEIEIKLRLEDHTEFQTRLAAAGFKPVRPRVFEANTLYDADETLRASGRMLRLREVGGKSVVTFKGPATRGKHKSREELETSVEDAATLARIFQRLGFEPAFRYEKFRTEFECPPDPGVVTVDETPIGWFAELEGAPDWIDGTAAKLGFSESDYLTDSYGSLYLNYCNESGKSPSQMVFTPNTLEPE